MHLMPLFSGQEKSPDSLRAKSHTLPMPYDNDRIFFRGHPMVEGLPFS
jgi:hypothetical protein